MTDKPIRDEAMREAERLMHEYHSASPVAKNLTLMIATALDNFQAARAKPTQDVAEEAEELERTVWNTLLEAAETFKHYGNLHAAKPDEIKARRNYDMAEECFKAHSAFKNLVSKNAIQAARDEGARQAQQGMAGDGFMGHSGSHPVDGSIPSPATKSQDAAQSLGASDHLSSVQHSKPPSACDAGEADAQEPLGAKGRLNSLEHGNAPLPASAAPSGLIEAEVWCKKICKQFGTEEIKGENCLWFKPNMIEQIVHEIQQNALASAANATAAGKVETSAISGALNLASRLIVQLKEIYPDVDYDKEIQLIKDAKKQLEHFKDVPNAAGKAVPDILFKLAEQYKKLTEGKYKTAEIIDKESSFDCPMCEGDGCVSGEQYINFNNKPLNVLFSGIGDEFIGWQKLFDDVIEILRSTLPPVSEVRRKAFNEAADICEKMFIDSGWNSHYRNAAIKCSSAIRSLIDKEKETP